MEIRNLYNNIYIDPLTCLPNFFKFLESDFKEVFGERGVILIFDIAEMEYINKSFGRCTGDLYIKTLSDVIFETFNEFNSSSIFRTHGDEFTVILRDVKESVTEGLCSKIKDQYLIRMRDLGFSEAELSMLVLCYRESIHSIENYYEVLYKGINNQEEKIHGKFTGEKLFKEIVGGVINRVKETLSYYDNACSLALVDDISGLPNHRAGQIHLSDLLQSYKTDVNGFSLLFIDGDDLKRYNKISYESGNDMIRKLSGIISDILRNQDKMFRWFSGDEFLIVLKETNEINAVKIAERIRQAVEEKTKEWVYPITISIGVSCYPKDGDNITELISKAEKANGLAKEAGKNQVFMWENLVN